VTLQLVGRRYVVEVEVNLRGEVGSAYRRHKLQSCTLGGKAATGSGKKINEEERDEKAYE